MVLTKSLDQPSVYNCSSAQQTFIQQSQCVSYLCRPLSTLWTPLQARLPAILGKTLPTNQLSLTRKNEDKEASLFSLCQSQHRGPLPGLNAACLKYSYTKRNIQSCLWIVKYWRLDVTHKLWIKTARGQEVEFEGKSTSVLLQWL